MIIVPSALRVFLLTSCLLLQACQQTNDDSQSPVKNKADLSKAATYNVQLGLGYLKQGDTVRAKKKFLTAMKQEPNSSDVNAALGYFYEETKEIDKAKTHYLKAISLSSNNGAQLNNYGAFLCRQGEYKEAESNFLRAVKDEHYIHTAGAYENAGLCALATPDNQKAKHYLTQALNQDPLRKKSLYELVKLEYNLGQESEALELLKSHETLVLNDDIFLTLAKQVADKAGQHQLAEQYQNSLKELALKNNNSGVNNDYSNHN